MRGRRRRGRVDLREIDEGSLDAARGALARADLVVDALFGIGLSRPVSGWRAELVAAMNEARAPRLAVDVPSGLDASSSEIRRRGPHVRADVTVTFFAPKRALVLLPAGGGGGGGVVVAAERAGRGARLESPRARDW